MSKQAVIELLGPILRRVKSLDLTNPTTAREALERDFPPAGDLMRQVRELGSRGLAEGWLCAKQAGSSKFSRVAKPEAADGFSIDAVLLSGDGPWHQHIKGEVNCLIPTEGVPKFCGFEPSWAVFEPGSQHVPRVEGGTMLIFYMLPDGAVEWNK